MFHNKAKQLKTEITNVLTKIDNVSKNIIESAKFENLQNEEPLANEESITNYDKEQTEEVNNPKIQEQEVPKKESVHKENENEKIAQYIKRIDDMQKEINKLTENVSIKCETIKEMEMTFNKLQSTTVQRNSKTQMEMTPEGEVYKTLNIQYKKQISKLEQTLRAREDELKDYSKLKKSYELQKRCTDNSLKKTNSLINDCEKLTKELEIKSNALIKVQAEKTEADKKIKETQEVLEKAAQENATMEEELKLLRDFAYNVDKSSLDKHYITYMPKSTADQNTKTIDSLIMKLNQIKLPTIGNSEKAKLIDMTIEQFKDYNLNYAKVRSNEESLMNLLEQVYNNLTQGNAMPDTLADINKTLRKILYEKTISV